MIRQFAIAAGTVVLGVGVVIFLTYLRPLGSGIGAFMSRGTLAQTLIGIGVITLIVAGTVGLLWSAFGDTQRGRLVGTAVGAVAIGFVLLVAWDNCMIPHEFCSAIP